MDDTFCKSRPDLRGRNVVAGARGRSRSGMRSGACGRPPDAAGAGQPGRQVRAEVPDRPLQRLQQGAVLHWNKGVRPSLAPNWRLADTFRQPGRRGDHRLSKRGGVWTCDPSCQATAFYRWHRAHSKPLTGAWELGDHHDDAADRAGRRDRQADFFRRGRRPSWGRDWRRRRPRSCRAVGLDQRAGVRRRYCRRNRNPTEEQPRQ